MRGGLGAVASRPRAVPDGERMRVLRSFRVRMRVAPWLCVGLSFAWPGCGGKSSTVPTSPPHPAGASGGPAGAAGAPVGASGGGGASDAAPPLQPGECRSIEDCGSALYCLEPGGHPPGGLCPPANCSDDSDCRADGGTSICEPRPQNCGKGNSCTGGCTGDADCSVGQSCKDLRCVQASCAKDADCPTDFACSAGACQRKSCSADSTCSTYCVQGFCYSTPGSCEQGRP